MDAGILDFITRLGTTGILAFLLWRLLERATEERKEITKQFLDALRGTVEQSTEAMKQNAVVIARVEVQISENRAESNKNQSAIVAAIDALKWSHDP